MVGFIDGTTFKGKKSRYSFHSYILNLSTVK